MFCLRVFSLMVINIGDAEQVIVTNPDWRLVQVAVI